MSRPTFITLDTHALLHNVQRVRELCPGRAIIAMVKANAYGCGLPFIVPSIEHHVDAFGVACLEEAMAVRALSAQECILFQGVFSQDELPAVSVLKLQCVIHHEAQLRWLLETPLRRPIRVWIKVNTGMHRLGFELDEVASVIDVVSRCSWVSKPIGLMTHFACADEVQHELNQRQWDYFHGLDALSIDGTICRSVANSAVILSHPEQTYDAVRPGIMLYGISPFSDVIGDVLGLRPVMSFRSAVSVIHDVPIGCTVGYGATWQTKRFSRIGIVAAGYGDGYPRHIAEGTCVFVRGQLAPIVGRVSMDMMTVDLTDVKGVERGDEVELWGEYLPVEHIAQASATIPYELMCQVTSRVRERARIKCSDLEKVK